jgi:putative membrane protein
MKKTILILSFFVGLIISGINPHDYFTWFLEVLPALLGFIFLFLTYKNFQFTYFTYTFILIHAYILFIGAHFTYAEVPLFDWIKDVCHFSRNNYDKVGHFFQGFVPAMIVRELLIRKEIVKTRSWLNFIVASICLAISALYELVEWVVSVLTKESGDSFLGTQGYIWDTQSDMLFAMIGAICMLIFLSRIQDKKIINY